MINHLSFPRAPERPSINDGIDIEMVPLRYETLDSLFQEIRSIPPDGEEYWLWKADLQDAYWHVGIATEDTHLLGYHLDDVMYEDCTLNFGGRSSPFIFNKFAEALHWIMEAAGFRLHHYLDDFFGLVPKRLASYLVKYFRTLCLGLGIVVSTKKTVVGPCVEILGITVNMTTKIAWISPEKLSKLRVQLTVATGGEPSVDDIRSLAGSLLFVSRVCPYGRAFIWGLYDFVAGARNRSGDDESVLPRGTMTDLRWWASTLNTWTGSLLLYEPVGTQEIWTDAASTKGIGGHLGPKTNILDTFCHAPRLRGNHDIMQLEAMALKEALERWGQQLRHHRITCKVDNTVLASALVTGRVRHEPTQEVIREIFGLAIAHSLTLVPDWIPSAENDVADALSRFDSAYLLLNYPLAHAMTEFPARPFIPALSTPALPSTPPTLPSASSSADITVLVDDLITDGAIDCGL
jgi:hypothetical protein